MDKHGNVLLSLHIFQTEYFLLSLHNLETVKWKYTWFKWQCINLTSFSIRHTIYLFNTLWLSTYYYVPALCSSLGFLEEWIWTPEVLQSCQGKCCPPTVVHCVSYYNDVYGQWGIVRYMDSALGVCMNDSFCLRRSRRWEIRARKRFGLTGAFERRSQQQCS